MSDNNTLDISTNKKITSILSPIPLKNIINITPSDNTNSNIVINNTLKINYTNSVIDNKSQLNINSSIELKDKLDGQYKELYIHDNDLFIIPMDYFNNNLQYKGLPSRFIKYDELETILNDNNNTITRR